MHEYVLARVLSHGPESVIDGYSGSGELALALARTGVRVHAIELDSDASSHAAVRLPAGSTAISAKVEEVLSSLLPADVVVLNPPRTGVDGRVTEQLEQSDSGAARHRVRQLQSGDARARPRANAALSHRVAPRVRHVSADGTRRERVRARAGVGMIYVVEVNGQRFTVDVQRGRSNS